MLSVRGGTSTGWTGGIDFKADGTIKIPGGSPGADKVLTSDASGNATWEEASSSGATVGQAIAMAIVFGGF